MQAECLVANVGCVWAAQTPLGFRERVETAQTHPTVLRELAERVRGIQARYRPPARRISSGFEALDAALGGGFPAGALHELVAASHATAGRTLALRIAANAAGPGRWILYFDAAGDLYPPAAEFMGLALDRLLIMRIHRRGDTLWALEQTLRCPAVAAAVASVGKLEPLEARRLQLAAETGGGVLLLVSTPADSRADRAAKLGPATFAATRIRLLPLTVESGGRGVRAEIIKSREGGATRAVDVVLEDGFHAEGAEKTQRRKSS